MKYILVKTYGGIVDSVTTFHSRKSAVSGMKKEIIACNGNEEYDFYIFEETGTFVTNRKQQENKLLILVPAAEYVVDCWENGDLAGAVRNLSSVLEKIKGMEEDD